MRTHAVIMVLLYGCNLKYNMDFRILDADLLRSGALEVGLSS